MADENTEDAIILQRTPADDQCRLQFSSYLPLSSTTQFTTTHGSEKEKNVLSNNMLTEDLLKLKFPLSVKVLGTL